MLKLFLPDFSLKSIVHSLAVISLGIFFVYAGTKKFIPKPAKPVNNESLIKALENDMLEPPVSFKLTMKSFRQSGFIFLVGSLQIVSGLLMLFRYTRLIGLLMLLPVTINIFSLHVFMDNRPDENYETGFYLFANLVLMLYYLKSLKSLLQHSGTTPVSAETSPE